MSGYGEDRANSQVNTSTLEDEFNIDTSEETTQHIQEIKEMRQVLLETIGDSNRDPDDILYVNINRANDLLDIVQKSILDGGQTNARLFEVAAQMINAITSAATSVQNSGFGAMKHEYNMRMVEVKEKEVAVKAAIAQDKTGNKQSGGGVTDGKVVVMTREELLNMIDNENAEVEIQSVSEQNNES